MTDQQTMPATGYPTTPPLELLKHWEDQWFDGNENLDVLLIQAFQTGADQELEACCEWLDKGFGDVGNFPATLRADRRPKPPSLKEQSIALLDRIQRNKQQWLIEELDVIRRVLEQLND